MKILRPSLSIAFLLVATCAQAQWTVTGQVVPELAVFDTQMKQLMMTHNVPAGAVAVAWQGRMVLAHGYSWNPGAEDFTTQPDSLFRIASCSKPITSTLVNRLIQEGRLAPGDTVAQHVDLTPRTGASADPRLASVTIRNLLEMLGGFGDPATLGYDPVFRDSVVAQGLGIPLPVSKEDIIRYQSGEPLVANPGTTYHYSNYGYLLLGRVIEAVTGLSYEDYAQTVFKPIGVHKLRQARARKSERATGEVAYHSGYTAPSVLDPSGTILPVEYGGSINEDHLDAYGGWVGSAPDLLRWATNLDDPSAPDAILDQASLARTFALPENYPLPYQDGEYYYASGWAVRHYAGAGYTTWHAGSLPSTSSYVVRVWNGYEIVILLNRRDEGNADAMTSAMDAVVWNSLSQVTSWPSHDLFPRYLDTIWHGGFE